MFGFMNLKRETTPEQKAVLSLSTSTAWFDQPEAQWSSRAFDRHARAAYRSNPIAHRAIRLIVECAASLPFRISDQISVTDQQAVRDLMTAPNPFIDGRSFLEQLYGHLLLHGNAFLHVEGHVRVEEWCLLPPDRVSILTGNAGWPIAYVYRVGDKEQRFPVDAATGMSDLIHVRSFAPSDMLKGEGALAAAGAAIDLYDSATAWNKALVDQGARPSGALVYSSGNPHDTALSSEQVTRLREQLDDLYSGPRNAGRPLLLEGGLSWQAMALTPQDMDFTEAKRAAARDIALAFGVPPMLLGIPGDNTYANYQEANRALWRLTIIPLAQKVAAALGKALRIAGNRQPLSLNLDDVPALVGERERRWQLIATADFLADEEKRRLLGLEPSP